MMLLLIAATVAAQVPMPTFPATDAASKAAITAYIERCAREWADSHWKFDPEVYQRCHADDYRGFSASGKLATKQTLLEPDVPTGKAAGVWYVKPRFISPEFAIVEGEEWAEPKDGSAKKHLIWNDIWAFRDGKWQIVGSQDSLVPYDQPLLNTPD